MNSILNRLNLLYRILRLFCLLIVLFPIDCFARIDFFLVDANADNDISKITDGETIDLNQVGRALNIRADVSDSNMVNFVRFELNNRQVRTEGIIPYALAGDKRGDYNVWTPDIGHHTLKALAYNSNPTKIDEQTIEFRVTSSSSESNIIFTLVNTSTNRDIHEIDDSDTIELGKVGKELSIRADVLNDTRINSIRFELNNQHIRTEGIAPYALAGDRKGDYYSYDFNTGQYALKAIAYDTGGASVTERLISFTVIDSGGDDDSNNDSDDNTVPDNTLLFTLVNSLTNKDIAVIKDNSTIDPGKVGSDLNIRADIQNNPVVSSVRFELDSKYIRTEGIAPYALAGDKRGDYYAWDFSAGQHILKAIAYGSTTNIIAENTIHFTISEAGGDGDSDPPVNSKFNKDRDILSLHFDHRADLDDGHATVADRTVTLHYGITPHVVSGTYGNQPATYQEASERVMQTVWGNGGWLNAHDNRSRALSTTVDVWRTAIDKGGHVWVKEGGQSDFTADAVKELRKKLSKETTKARIHVVQHSDWNETYTRSYNLTYVKNNTDYIKIADGNKKGNGTAGLREEPKTTSGNRSIQKFMDSAQSSNYRKYWDAAFNYLNPRTDKLDFSDTVELLHILGIGTGTVADCDDFSEVFLSR